MECPRNERAPQTTRTCRDPKIPNRRPDTGRRTLPSQVVEQKTTNEVFSNYVLNNADLNLAYRAMGRDGALSAAQMNEYKATYGKGLNEKHFIDGWNRLNPQQAITDIGQLSQAEWGMLHYLLHGRHEGRPLKKSVEQATRFAA